MPGGCPGQEQSDSEEGDERPEGVTGVISDERWQGKGETAGADPQHGSQGDESDPDQWSASLGACGAGVALDRLRSPLAVAMAQSVQDFEGQQRPGVNPRRPRWLPSSCGRPAAEGASIPSMIPGQHP